MSEHLATKWDVYRDPDGRPVTITDQQCAAIQHAVRVWAEVTEAEGYTHAPQIRALVDAFSRTVMSKSCLMGRMLYDGKPPYDEAPPVYGAAPAYHLWDDPSTDRRRRD